MKLKNLLALFFLTFSFPVFSQTIRNVDYKSDVDKFSEKSGSLIENTIEVTGKISQLEIGVIKATNLLDNSKVSGVRLYLKDGLVEYKLTLDKNVAEDVSKFLKIVRDKTLKSRPELYTELKLKTKNEFEIGCYAYPKDKFWTLYIDPNYYIKSQKVLFEQEDIYKMIEYLDKAIAKLTI